MSPCLRACLSTYLSMFTYTFTFTLSARISYHIILNYILFEVRRTGHIKLYPVRSAPNWDGSYGHVRQRREAQKAA